MAGLGILALIGCDAPSLDPGTTPKPRPPGLLAPKPPPMTPKAPSQRSEELAFFYKRVQENLLAQDLLRVDGGSVDTPYTDTSLARNFERIAFYQENVVGSVPVELRDQAFLLQKWDQPVRFQVEFGSTIPAEAQAHDTQIIKDYVSRLSRTARHPMRVTKSGGNFFVLVMGQDDRETTLRRALEINPGIDINAVKNVLDRGRTISCAVFTFSSGEDDYTPDIALSIIRTELPALMRKSCYHEELAQGLGLANDSPQARPSIFNDDDEFALLTTHDEELLRLLYNPALSPGMSADGARPIVQQILLGRAGPS